MVRGFCFHVVLILFSLSSSGVGSFPFLYFSCIRCKQSLQKKQDIKPQRTNSASDLFTDSLQPMQKMAGVKKPIIRIYGIVRNIANHFKICAYPSPIQTPLYGFICFFIRWIIHAERRMASIPNLSQIFDKFFFGAPRTFLVVFECIDCTEKQGFFLSSFAHLLLLLVDVVGYYLGSGFSPQ